MAEPQQYPFKELEKFQLYTDTPGNQGKRSRMTWSSYRGNPRITVFTNVPNDTGKGMINAPMNPETFLVFLDLLETVARTPGESKYKIDCWSMVRPPEGGERTNEKVLLSEVYFGRDAAGVIWISVVAANRPKIKFDYKVSDFHKIYKGDGTQMSEAESSTLQTLATTRALRDVMMVHMGELRPPYVPGQASNTYGNKAAAPVKVSTENFGDITF